MIGNITNAIRILEKKRNLSVNLSKNLPPGELLTSNLKYVTSPVINFIATLNSGGPVIINIVGSDNQVYGTFSLDTIGEHVESGLITNLPPALKHELVSGTGTFQIVCSPTEGTLSQEFIGDGDDTQPASQTLDFGGLTSKNDLANTDFIVGYDSVGDVNFKSALDNVTKYIKNIPTVNTTANNITLEISDSGKVITNNTATQNLFWNLPAAIVGRGYKLRNDTDSYTLNINPNGNERISYGGEGKSLTLLTRGRLDIECVYSGRWDIATSVGISEFEA